LSSDPSHTATDVGRAHTQPATEASTSGPLRVAGKMLAHFRLERPLGRGGMGEVWLASDTALDRPVAVKLLGRDFADAPALRERFYREARAQARIHHPNVGHLYFIGEDGEQLFFAMEYIDGESLQARLDRAGKLPLAEALEMCRQAALGLREAHRLGFTHRDVKPSNLMLDRHGVVKLVDFGIVKNAAEEGDLRLTAASAAVIGTPHYMAPEQARTGEVDHRSDIYALGATLHHLVAGKPPFEGTTALQLVSKHLTEPRPTLPSATRGRDTGADELLDRMMAKEPADRFQNYDELIGAIEQASPASARRAGFWVRAFAAGMDLMFVVLVSALIALASQGLLTDPLDDLLVFGLIWTYEVFTTARFGRGLGKALLELEVVTADGRRPGNRVALLRTLVQIGPFYLGMGGMSAIELISWPGRAFRVVWIVLSILLMAWPLLAGLASTLRPDRRTPWDRISHTRVRYRGSRAEVRS
jgi:serine/threonine-protein kinase